MGRTVTVLGSTGLIGTALVNILLNDRHTDRIIALVRRTIPNSDPKLEQYVIDFTDPQAYETHMAGSEAVFSAIGTTRAQVSGDKNAYRKVDYDINVHAAKAAAKTGAYSFIMVSSIGADPNNNNNFYLKLKGITEEAVCKEKIPQIRIVRPSLLLGKRSQKRLGESMAIALAPFYSWLFRGKWARYKPIPAEEVAMAMNQASKSTEKGIRFLEYKELQDLLQDAG